jgi:hypothetical protein
MKLQHDKVPYFADSADSVVGLVTPSSINTWILAITASSKYRSDNWGRLDLGTRESTQEKNCNAVTVGIQHKSNTIDQKLFQVHLCYKEF